MWPALTHPYKHGSRRDLWISSNSHQGKSSASHVVPPQRRVDRSTDPTNAARVRQEQTDAKTLTRSQNEYESITFEQCCEQVPNEAAVEAELEEHASLQHGHGHACRKPPRWPPRRPQHRPARPGGGPSVGTGPPEVRGAAGAAQVDVVYAFTDSMCLLEQLTCRSTKAEALYGERVTSATD